MLTRNDAYAVARALAGLPPDDRLHPRAFAQTLIQNYRTFLEQGGEQQEFIEAVRLTLGSEMVASIFSEDPLAPPPEPIDPDVWIDLHDLHKLPSVTGRRRGESKKPG